MNLTFATAVDLNNCPKQIKYPTCKCAAVVFKLPSNISPWLDDADQQRYIFYDWCRIGLPSELKFTAAGQICYCSAA